MILSPFGRIHADQSLAQNPSGDGLALRGLVVFVLVFAGLAENGLDVRPIMGGIDDDQFVTAFCLAELGTVGAGRDADRLFIDQRSAQGLGGSESCKKKCNEAKNREFPKWECRGLARYPPSPAINGIIGLEENCEIILGLQSFAGKILETQHLAGCFFNLASAFGLQSQNEHLGG